MSKETEETSEVYNYYLKLHTPTEEDLRRVFTEDELKELCLKQKCRVDIWRWNVVHNYRMLFTQSGRYQRWSEGNRLESYGIDSEVESQLEVDTQEVNEEQVEKQTQADTVSANVEVNSKPVSSENEEVTQPVGVNLIEADINEDYFSDRDSEDSLETVMLNEKQSKNTSASLKSDVVPDIENNYSVNTMSMTIDTEMSTQTQGLQSQDVIASNYDNFKDIIP
ncbi:Telomere-binding protein cav [Eumeta japonica]|uniref:Telomere-binding protein cav n=1 Tax=Eumeta variegata TaxID=151549 RepID=A0A4C1SHJ6_EUMVA|nr:Telomere-binding protein cav [Eumeta japonica]